VTLGALPLDQRLPRGLDRPIERGLLNEAAHVGLLRRFAPSNSWINHRGA
jgi:hypothetical protein